ncbi:MAG: imidazole glycerol phosphate synthase subunit HisH [Gammaproteobacteria bacterium]|nr:imidazole glycerol phosphate synthase subunit HisH [Gammaproteobacteria bacterium]
MIGVVDTGGANLTSLFAAFERLGARAEMVDSAAGLARSSRVVLPGVGAAGEAMRRLQRAGLANLIAGLRVPVLGICLGMQLLFEQSAEDDSHGLSVLPGRVDALVARGPVTVPHMGWSRLKRRRASPLMKGIDTSEYFYFVHSFVAEDSDLTVASVTHGRSFSAVVQRDNFFGTQFHPERSGRAGSRLLENFLAI